MAELPKDVTKAAVQGSLDKVEDPAVQRQLRRILERPDMRAVERELVAGLVDGTLETLAEKERAERIQILTSQAMARVLQIAARDLPTALAPAVQSAVGGALDAALSPARQPALERSVSGLVTTSVRAVASGLRNADVGAPISEAMTEQIGPALATSMRKDVAPGLAAMLANDDFRRELGATARTLGRETVLGMTEALGEKKEPPKQGSPLSRAADVAAEGAKLLGTASWFLLLVIVALGLWILKLLAQARRYREEAEKTRQQKRFYQREHRGRARQERSAGRRRVATSHER